MPTRKLRGKAAVLAGGAGLLFALYLGFCQYILAALITPERNSGPVPTAAELKVKAVQPLTLQSQTDNTPLQGWFIPAEADQEQAIIVLHGLHSYAWNCLSKDLAEAYAQAGFAVLLFDLRGHGRSGGEHLGLGLLEQGDVQAAVDWLLAQGFRSGQIGIHGTSYGAAITLLSAGKLEAVGAVVADSAFANMADVVGGELKRQIGLPTGTASLLQPGLRLLGQGQYGIDLKDSAPEQTIGAIAPRPILLIHGTQDGVIPYDHAQRLQRAAASQTELWTLPIAHVEGLRLHKNCEVAPTRTAFIAKVTQFFETHLAPSP